MSENTKTGLERLRAAVLSSGPIERTWKTSQRPSTIEKTAAFCRLWKPEDTYASWAARHQMDAELVHKRMLRIRAKIPDVPKKISLSPWQIAVAYLDSLPASYRKSTES